MAAAVAEEEAALSAVINGDGFVCLPEDDKDDAVADEKGCRGEMSIASLSVILGGKASGAMEIRKSNCRNDSFDSIYQSKPLLPEKKKKKKGQPTTSIAT